uniref:Transmembrane protein 164 n=1 Tax=Anopheles maculatus TaxID=74869 RepID=A0A182SZV8_9DIPT
MQLSWAYDGVNGSVPRNTGPECAEYLSPSRKLMETIVIIPLCLIAIKCSVSRLKPITYRQLDRRCVQAGAVSGRGSALPGEILIPSWGKQFLLVTMTLTLGVELGFKFATRTVIYILNPCHITTIMQIYLLACNKPTRSSTVLFRLQMNFLNGPLLAFMFPETDSRQLPLESSIYWIQHALMCIIPVFLLRIGGVYNMEALNDFTWNVIGYATLIIYHFGVLQVVATPVQVNLNHMLCPALKDPFEGSNYRIFAVFHEAILCTLLCKLVTFLFSPLPSSIANHPTFKNGMPTDSSPIVPTTTTTGSSTSLPLHIISSSRPSSRSSSPAKSTTLLQENNIIIKTSKID